MLSRKKENLALRAEIIQAVRQFFIDRHYLEVDTPSRIPAPAPEANIEAQPSGNWFLQTSPELCMKRLLSAGYPLIFQISKCFRLEERGEKHLPEFTMLEWYRSGITYAEMMEETEDMVCFAASRVLGKSRIINFQDMEINLQKPWQRLTLSQAFEKYGTMSLAQALRENRVDEEIGFEIEPKLGIQAPVFLYDYPASMGALARKKPGDPEISERFELYIGGIELCNAFSELTDPVEQRQRFKHELSLRAKAGKIPYPMPDNFLKALARMPQASGNALGIDRLVMILANKPSIDHIVAFTPEEL